MWIGSIFENQSIFFVDIHKLILKFVWKGKETKVMSLKQINKVAKDSLFAFKT